MSEYVVVSGYYGFDNLGDEAILEEIISEVGRLVDDKSKIVVLSQNPEKTKSVFGVSSVDRWSLSALQPIFSKAKLFISGGGGLYQDTTSVKSVVYYAGLAVMARLFGVPMVIYAQGVGPLRSAISVALTKTAMLTAKAITVRDSNSVALLESWGVKNAVLSADPVWCLEPTALPASVTNALDSVPSDRFLLGLSLRESGLVSRSMVEDFALSIAENATPGTVLVPLALQVNQDMDLLDAFATVWQAQGLECVDLDFSEIMRPSQWISLMSRFDLVVGMRFHALLMALKSGVPTVGLAYDPKVSYMMKNFDQPSLNLVKGMDEKDAARQLGKLMESALCNIPELKDRAVRVSSAQKQLACQNFEVIAKILKN
jgi:polysaccharide pyruvyl transferase CsaB